MATGFFEFGKLTPPVATPKLSLPGTDSQPAPSPAPAPPPAKPPQTDPVAAKGEMTLEQVTASLAAEAAGAQRTATDTTVQVRKNQIETATAVRNEALKVFGESQEATAANAEARGPLLERIKGNLQARQQVLKRPEIVNDFLWIFSGGKSKYSKTQLTEEIAGDAQMLEILDSEHAARIGAIKTKLEGLRTIADYDSTIGNLQIQTVEGVAKATETLHEIMVQQAQEGRAQESHQITRDNYIRERVFSMLTPEAAASLKVDAAQTWARGEAFEYMGVQIGAGELEKHEMSLRQARANYESSIINNQKGRRENALDNIKDSLAVLPLPFLEKALKTNGLVVYQDGEQAQYPLEMVQDAYTHRVESIKKGHEAYGKVRGDQIGAVGEVQVIADRLKWLIDNQHILAPNGSFSPQVGGAITRARALLDAVSDEEGGIDPESVMRLDPKTLKEISEGVVNAAAEGVKLSVGAGGASGKYTYARLFSQDPDMETTKEVALEGIMGGHAGMVNPQGPLGLAFAAMRESAFSYIYDTSKQGKSMFPFTDAGNWSSLSDEQRNQAMTDLIPQMMGQGGLGKEQRGIAMQKGTQRARQILADETLGAIYGRIWESHNMSQYFHGADWRDIDARAKDKAWAVAAQRTNMSEGRLRDLQGTDPNGAELREYYRQAEEAYSTTIFETLDSIQVPIDPKDPTRTASAAQIFVGSVKKEGPAHYTAVVADIRQEALQNNVADATQRLLIDGNYQEGVLRSLNNLADRGRQVTDAYIQKGVEIRQNFKDPKKKTLATAQLMGIIYKLPPPEEAAFLKATFADDPEILARYPAEAQALAEKFINDPKKMADIKQKFGENWALTEKGIEAVLEGLATSSDKFNYPMTMNPQAGQATENLGRGHTGVVERAIRNPIDMFRRK